MNRPVTIFHRFNPKKGAWFHNHITDYYWPKPIPMCLDQSSSWVGAVWQARPGVMDEARSITLDLPAQKFTETSRVLPRKAGLYWVKSNRKDQPEIREFEAHHHPTGVWVHCWNNPLGPDVPALWRPSDPETQPAGWIYHGGSVLDFVSMAARPDGASFHVIPRLDPVVVRSAVCEVFGEDISDDHISLATLFGITRIFIFGQPAGRIVHFYTGAGVETRIEWGWL